MASDCLLLACVLYLYYPIMHLHKQLPVPQFSRQVAQLDFELVRRTVLVQGHAQHLGRCVVKVDGLRLHEILKMSVL